MEMPKQFKINNKDFKIYFDNKEKKHVCENLDTGEKTNISVIGTLLQMGILEPVKIESDTGEKLVTIEHKIQNLDLKIDRLMNRINVNEKMKDIEEKIMEEPETKEKPRSKLNEEITKKMIEKSQETDEVEIPEEEIEIEEESNAVEESDEEIENWKDI